MELDRLFQGEGESNTKLWVKRFLNGTILKHAISNAFDGISLLPKYTDHLMEPEDPKPLPYSLSSAKVFEWTWIKVPDLNPKQCSDKNSNDSSTSYNPCPGKLHRICKLSANTGWFIDPVPFRSSLTLSF